MMDIQLFITDVDGTLTNGCITVDGSGIPIKTYNTRDFCGLAMLNESGVRIAIITGDPCRKPLLERFKFAASYVNESDIRTGIYNKEIEVLSLLKEYNLEMDQVAFIGDEINDIKLMEEIKGYIGCPLDSIEEIRTIVESSSIGFVSNKKGGEGAVRDFCEFILRCNGKKPFWAAESFRRCNGNSNK